MKSTNEKKVIKVTASKVATVRANKRIEKAVEETTKKTAKMTTEEKIAWYCKNNSLGNDASVALQDFCNRGFTLSEAKFNIKHIHIDYDYNGKTYRYILKFKIDTEHDCIDITNLIPMSGQGTFCTALDDGKTFAKPYTTALNPTACSLHKADFVADAESLAKHKLLNDVKAVEYMQLKKAVYFIMANGSKDVTTIPKENRTNTEKAIVNNMEKAIAKAKQVSKALAKKAEKIA